MYERVLPRRDGRRPAAAVPLPEHALLALQRSAGNHAVTRVLARRVLEDRKISTLVSQCKPGATTADELRLAIYKRLGGAKGKNWTDVGAAQAELIKGEKIDDQDVAAIAKAARAAFGEKDAADQDAASLEQIKSNAEKDRTSMNATYGAHIFYGGFSGKVPTGFHYQGEPLSATHETYGAAEPTGFPGVYTQSVRTKATPHQYKPKQSTFFPDKLSKNEVLDAIATVFGKNGGFADVQYPASLKGLKLHKIGTNTVMPEGGGDKERVLDAGEDAKTQPAKKGQNKARK